MESLRKHLNQLLKEAIELDNNLLNRLPKSILQEAIQGKLVPQIKEEGTAQALLEQIQQEKQKLVKEGKLKKSVLNDSAIFRGDDNRYYDIYTKGGKIRRIYIPKKLRLEAEEWLKQTKRASGYLFLNRYGERITTRGISQQLKNYAEKYGLNKKVVYPHSFRHRYAKNFLEKFNDIALLADLMGHESIETTRIYLRRSSTEQQQIVDEVITW